MSTSAQSPLSSAFGAMPAALATVIKHHMRQHIESATAFVGKMVSPPVFYLGVLEATAIALNGAVVANGKGMFTGPLKTATTAERDMVAAQFPELAPELRGRLDSAEKDLVILISRVDLNGQNYSAVTGIGVRDTAAPAAD